METNRFPPNWNVPGAIRNVRLTATPVVRFAQIAVIGRRSAERIEPIQSLPFEYLLGGGILWLAQHMTSASTAFVLSRMMPGGCAMSETRKIAAILVSDVVGYSRLAGADEDRTLARLRALRSDLIDPTISVHHGRIVKRTGDGSVIEFRSVVDAVRCAVEVQHAMVERNAGVALDKRIEFRIGIHLGDVVEESDGDLMGDGVNIAARLEGIAAPGAICLSEDAYRQVSGRLDMAVTDLGQTELKNIERSIRVYSLQVGVPAQAKPATEAKPAEPKKHSRRTLLGAGIVGLIVIAAGTWYLLGANPPAQAAHLSVVVLPFTNLSNDPTQDYFADGVTENLTTDLSRIRNSFVIARNTAFTFKGKNVDAKEIGKELGVRYVLEGSVQRDGTRVRVNAQLIDAETGAHLWADRFEEDVADLFKLQDQVVARIANSLRVELVNAESRRPRQQNPDAVDLTMRGWALMLHDARTRSSGAEYVRASRQARSRQRGGVCRNRLLLYARSRQRLDRPRDRLRGAGDWGRRSGACDRFRERHGRLRQGAFSCNDRTVR
jgi:TolB-like protein/class 3 adenylate cyclase